MMRSMDRSAKENAVTEAMAAVPRADFLPAEVQHLAEADAALPLGYGQTNSQPRTVADMLRLLGAEPGHRVLDVGAGSGWSTALLGHLVGETGEVLGTELVPELAQQAASTVAQYAMSWAQVRRADPDLMGLPEAAPFDRILVSAEAETLPDQLVDQLAVGGVMVVPVRGEMLRVVRERDDVNISKHGRYRFVPLL